MCGLPVRRRLYLTSAAAEAKRGTGTSWPVVRWKREKLVFEHTYEVLHMLMAGTSPAITIEAKQVTMRVRLAALDRRGSNSGDRGVLPEDDGNLLGDQRFLGGELGDLIVGMAGSLRRFGQDVRLEKLDPHTGRAVALEA